MEKDKLEEFLSTFKGSESSYPFGPEALVYKVRGKMYALIAQDEDVPRVTLKSLPADAEVLTSQFDAIAPGYYMNKKHWITVTLDEEVPDELLRELANKSYALVVSKLPKKDRTELV